MRRAWIAPAILAAAAVAALSPLGADYGNPGCHLNAPRCDEPAWPLEALARGDFARFVHDQPLMGPASLVLRAPFAAASRLFGADLTWHYRAGVFACLLVSTLLALALAQRSRARGHSRLHTTATAALVLVSPLATSAIGAGHPEELVAAAAVAGSALLVLDGRWTLAAVVLGCAIATKAWAILLVAPLLLCVAPPARRRFAVVAALIVIAFYLPLAVGDIGRFRTVVAAAGSLGSHYGEVTAQDPWSFTASKGDFIWASAGPDGQIAYSDATGDRTSVAVAHLAHALVLVSALLLTAAWWRAGGRTRPETLFVLIAAILLLRCILDPGDHLYYHAAVATALLGYEATRPRARLPWLAGGFVAAFWLIAHVDGRLHTNAGVASLYLAVAVPVLVALAVIACVRSRSSLPMPRPSAASRA